MEAGLERAILDRFEYRAYDFGPYSSVLVRELEALKANGVVRTRTSPLGTHKETIDLHAAYHDLGRPLPRVREVEHYSVSDKGLKAWRELVSLRFSPGTRDGLEGVKRRYNRMDLDELIGHVRRAHPAYHEPLGLARELFGLGSRPELTPFSRGE